MISITLPTFAHKFTGYIITQTTILYAKKNKPATMKSSLQAYLSDTGGRGRTGTPLRALDFESSASANSATPA